MSISPDGVARGRDAQVADLLAQAERLARQQQPAEARRIFREAESLNPDHPLVLHEKGRQLLASGDAAGALIVFQRLVQVAPGQVNHWLNLAAVLRRLEQHEAEMEALHKALALDPTHLVALLQKGALLELMGKPRTASIVYTHALQTLSPQTRLPPAIEAHVAHARESVSRNAAVLAGALSLRLSSFSAEHPPGSAPRMRFDRCVDRILGKQRVYVPEPTGTLFPFLANYEYYPRGLFPWLEALEAQTQDIFSELMGILKDDQPGIAPYIAYPAGVPLNQWRELNHSRRWGAYFLWNQGQRVEAHQTRCPRTTAALAEVPQMNVPGRGPTAFFSILDANTHIPPHTGVTNARLTVHLPLILPGKSRFRVGGETREWRMGEAWVFDDTIEHEAWNDADLPRAILIFDIWNPQLTPLERDMLKEMLQALQDFNEEGAANAIEGV